jgi:AraC-like DNA-binding protein
MLPEVKYYSPSEDISWIVKQFEFIKHSGHSDLTDKFVPREDVSLVFQFGAQPRLVSPVEQQLPRYFIAPVIPSANSICISGILDCFIATCKPTVLSRVLGISLAHDSRIYVPLADDVFGPIYEKMRRDRTPGERIASLTGYINSLYPGKYIPDATDLIFNAIVKKGINTNLSEIISQFSISERTLQRKFSKRLGATPKMLVRIMRINYIWDSISTDKQIDYHDLVFLGNYFDQTHMIKDFKSITGETPDVFFRRNLGFARILSGK